MSTIESLLLQYIAWVVEVSNAVVDFYLESSREIINVFHYVFQNMFTAGLYVAAIISLIFIILSVLSARYNKQKPTPITDEEAPMLTVHIPTMNEPVAIDCAKRCLVSNYPQDKLQILLGDDSDEPKVTKKLNEFAEKHENVDVIGREDNIGYKPGNLNNMLDYTKGEFIVVFDSDFLPSPDFLRDIVTPMVRDDTLHAVQGRWNPYNAGESLSAIGGAFIVDVFHHVALPVADRFFGTVVLAGSGECVRKSKLEELGRWKSGAFTEDTEYSMRLLRRGNRVEYAPYAPIDCQVPYTPMDLFLQQMRWAYGNATALYEHAGHIFSNMFRNNSKSARAGTYMISLILLGYVFGFLVLYLSATGILSFLTHPIGPIDFSTFFLETTLNFVLTSGLVIISLTAFIRSKRKNLIPRGLISLYTIGIITTVYVNTGIYRALTGKDMKWYLLSKGDTQDE